MAEIEKLYISQVTLPDGKTYWIKDDEARKLIDAIANKTTYAISKDAGTTPKGVTWESGDVLITGTAEASASSPIYLVPSVNKQGTDIYDEYIAVKINSNPDQFAWEKLGDTEVNFDNLGNLAYADTAKGFVSVAKSATATTTVTPSVTAASYTPAGTIEGGAFQGATMESQGSYTPDGDVTINSITPAGTNSSSAVDVKTTSDSIYSMTSAGSVTNGAEAQWEHTADSYIPEQSSTTSVVNDCSLTASVSNETLTLGFNKTTKSVVESVTPSSFTEGGFTWKANTPTAVVLPTRSSAKTVVTGITSATAAAQKFSGSAITPTGSFAGTTATITVSGTTTGSNTTQTFKGTAAQIAPKVTATANTSVELQRENKEVVVTPNK